MKKIRIVRIKTFESFEHSLSISPTKIPDGIKTKRLFDKRVAVIPEWRVY
jgi:hypothetical protein